MMMIPGMRLRALNFTGSWTSSVLARGEVIAAMNSLGLVLPLPAAGDQELHLLISEGQPLLVEMRGHLNPEGFYLWLYTPLMVGGELDEVVDELDRRIRATAGNGSRRWTSKLMQAERSSPLAANISRSSSAPPSRTPGRGASPSETGPTPASFLFPPPKVVKIGEPAANPAAGLQCGRPSG